MNSKIKKAKHYSDIRDSLGTLREDMEYDDIMTDPYREIIDTLESRIDTALSPAHHRPPNLCELVLTRDMAEYMADLLVSLVLHDAQETARNNDEPEFELSEKERAAWKTDALIWATQVLTEIAVGTGRCPVDIVRGVAETSGIPLPTVEFGKVDSEEKEHVVWPKDFDKIKDPRVGLLWQRVCDCLVFETLGHGITLQDDGDLEWSPDIQEFLDGFWRETPALGY